MIKVCYFLVPRCIDTVVVIQGEWNDTGTGKTENLNKETATRLPELLTESNKEAAWIKKVNQEDFCSHPGRIWRIFEIVGPSSLLHSGGLSCLPPAQSSSTSRASRISFVQIFRFQTIIPNLFNAFNWSPKSSSVPILYPRKQELRCAIV